jgi:alpha-beta hydrolase superfamily lysophospholipase
MPQRQLDRFPSLVDAPERSRLAASPRVRLHLAPGAGHNVAAQAEAAMNEVVREA